MTWRWNEVDGGESLEIYDHEGEIVQTVPHSGYGTDGIPPAIFEVMQEAAENSNPNSQYGFMVLQNAAFRDVEPLSRNADGG